MSPPFSRLRAFLSRQLPQAAISPKLIEKLVSQVKDRSSVLEFGYVSGLFALVLLRKRKHVAYLGVETRRRDIKGAKKLLFSEPLVQKNRNSFDFYHGRMYSIPFIGSLASYDYVFFFESLSHLSHDPIRRIINRDPVEDVVRCIKPVLNKGGALFIIEPMASSSGRRKLDRDKLARCLEDYGFRVEVNEPASSWANDQSAEARRHFVIKAVLK